jgi:hypothetical protein
MPANTLNRLIQKTESALMLKSFQTLQYKTALQNNKLNVTIFHGSIFIMYADSRVRQFLKSYFRRRRPNSATDVVLSMTY